MTGSGGVTKAAVAILLCGFASCSFVATDSSVTHTKILAAEEALLRYQFSKFTGVGSSNYVAICVSDQGSQPASDPSPSIISRFVDVSPVVKPWSACRWRNNHPVDLESGKPAILVEHYIDCGDRHHCKGNGSISYGNLGVERYNYMLNVRNGRWNVDQELTSIS